MTANKRAYDALKEIYGLVLKGTVRFVESTGGGIWTWPDRAKAALTEYEFRKTIPMKYRRLEFNAQLQTENERLTACLKQANSQAEEFERKWYLVQDERDTLQAKLTELEGQDATVKFHAHEGDFEWLIKYESRPQQDQLLYLTAGAEPVRRPATNEQLDEMQFKHQNTKLGFQWLAFARELEQHYGIKE